MISNLEVAGMNIKGIVESAPIDFNHLIKESEFHWQLMNEAFTPVCMAKLESPLSNKKVIIRLWKSGKINVTGAKSWPEVNKVLDVLEKDFKKILVVKNES